jgi:AraC family transcriptional regulator
VTQQLAIERALGARPGEPRFARGGLAGWQIRQAEEAAKGGLAGLTVGALARQARLSQDHYARCFQVSFGLSPVEWLLQRRLERAKAMLARSDDTVDQIAVTVGYRSGSQLARVFRRRVGVSPRAFRRR